MIIRLIIAVVLAFLVAALLNWAGVFSEGVNNLLGLLAGVVYFVGDGRRS